MACLAEELLGLAGGQTGQAQGKLVLTIELDARRATAATHLTAASRGTWVSGPASL
jgi:hypothetical protein